MSLEQSFKAKAVLESPAFQGAFSDCRTAIIARLEACSLTDTQTAEDLRRCLKLLKDVKLNLETAVNSGKLDAFRLLEDEKRKKNPLRNLFR